MRIYVYKYLWILRPNDDNPVVIPCERIRIFKIGALSGSLACYHRPIWFVCRNGLTALALGCGGLSERWPGAGGRSASPRWRWRDRFDSISHMPPPYDRRIGVLVKYGYSVLVEEGGKGVSRG